VIAVLALLGGCAADEAATYEAALISGACATLKPPKLRDGCALHHLHCELVEAESIRAECAFRVAERDGDPAGCVAAGGWADDCRLHLWSASFREWSPPSPRPGENETLVAEQLPRFGLAPSDPRPWSAWYRWVHGHTRPLDRSACSAVAEPELAEACRQTALAHYGDMLNVARDRGLYPCDGGPLPGFLEYRSDPEIDALRAARTDLCPS
jgi:hypothetical protein